jgi:hypothetical protein
MATPKTEAVTERIQRVKRVPVSGPRDILTLVGKDPNYVYRWVIDKPGRIQRFIDAGYEIVQRTDDLEVGQPTVDRGSRLGSAYTYATGGSLLVAMRQRKEWFKEDQDAKQLELDALEKVLYADGGLKNARRELGGTTPSETEEFRKGR